jgi:hypothetical protein
LLSDTRSVDGLAAETERGSDSKAHLPRRLERYAKAKERALTMRDFIAQSIPQGKEEQRLAHELHHCGSYLVFRHYLESDRVRLHAFRSCRLHLLCPFCAIRRGAKMLKRYLERVQLVRDADPTLRPHMVTLTVKDGPDLRERFQHLHRSLTRLHHRRHLGRGSQAEKITGAVWSYEFKRGSGSGQWHPHLHAVWLCADGERPRGASLSQEWAEITGDSHIVETHPLYGDPVDAFAEVFKYAVKFGGLPLADNWHGYQVLRTRRLVGSSGVLFGVEIPDDLADDDDAALFSEEFVELCYRFMRGYGYALTDTAGVGFAA